MEDRYLCRAKQTDNKNNSEWVEGLLTKRWGQLCVIKLDDENTAYPIDPATICQCTGIPDKNGKLMFEKDIAKSEDLDGNPIITSIVWYRDGWYLKEGDLVDCKLADSSDAIAVIGNEFDDKELLESYE